MKKVKVKLVLKFDVKTDPSDPEMLQRDVLEAAREELEALEDSGEEVDFDMEDEDADEDSESEDYE
jgi:hypothetical protein